MIIWRGWGILAFLYILASMAIFGGLGSSIFAQNAITLSIGFGLILAGTASWFTGVSLNRTRPQAKIVSWAVAREEQLEYLVQTGQFSLGPGTLQPQSHEEARAMAAELLRQETAQARNAYNNHTLFWIPMQYIGLLTAVAGVVTIVAGTFQLLG